MTLEEHPQFLPHAQLRSSESGYAGVNPEIVKNIARCNFLVIKTVMYIKVYISGMEMSQRVCF